jgi:hypothetical protein
MKSVDQYPLLNAACQANQSSWGKKALQTVVNALNTYTDSIPNPEFKSAKEALNTVVSIAEDSHRGLYSEAFSAAYHFPKVENYTFDLTFMYGNQVAGKVKLAKKKKFDNAQWFAVCAEIVDLYDALMLLKDKIVKRVGRSEEEKADDYVPPMPTTEAAILVTKVLKDMTDGLTLQYEDILFNNFVSSVQYRMDHPRTRNERYTPTSADFLLQTVGEGWDSHTGNYTRLVPNFKDLLRKIAQKDADYAQRMFLYKNVTKLAVVLEAKDNQMIMSGFGSGVIPEIIEGHVNGAGFQGEIVFHFADGSSFTVRNKVICNYSVHGKGFNQYPTTFHNVRLVKGVKPSSANPLAGQPSQQAMIEQFAGVK